MPTLICYDISDNSLRTKIADRLLLEGLERINLSVYLGNPTESSLTSMVSWCRAELAKKSNPARDSLVVLPVTESQIYRMIVLGSNHLDPDDITGNKTTLIL